MGLRVSETSITEELLYQFYQSYSDFGLPIRLFESVEEHRNGSDLEVLIQTDEGYILFACQAKITYKTGNYRSFHHKVGGERQIDLLQKYANRNGGIAQYLFYNFIPDYMMTPAIHALPEIKDQGITYLAAEDILAWMQDFKAAGKKTPVPGFTTFHPARAKPFHELICAYLTDKKTHLREIPPHALKTLTYYDEAEVSDPSAWRRATSVARIGYIEEDVIHSYAEENTTDLAPSKKQARQKAPPVFKPKFRVVIGGNANGVGLSRRS
jgi:hypothetical protein